MGNCKLQWAALFLSGLTAANVAVAGDSRSEQKARARDTTSKALAAELDGDFDARNKLLDEAAQLDPQSAAQSQLGKVRAKGGWLSIDAAAEKISDAKAMQRYEAARAEMQDTATAHWQMSQKCLAAKLPDQARAHMNRVLDLNPNYEPARAALGFKKIGGVWVSPEQIAADEAQAAAEAISVNKHGKLMNELLDGFTSKDSRKQSRSKQRLLELRDPSTIPAAEKILSPKNAEIAEIVVDYLANIKDPVATMSLVRHAVFYPTQEVRTEAAMKLSDRDLHDYAPPILSLLSNPIQSGTQPVLTRRGQLMGLRQVFTREGQDQNQVLVADTRIVRQQIGQVQNPTPAPRNPLVAAVNNIIAARENAAAEAMAQASVAAENQARTMQVNLQNQQIEKTNTLAMHALSTATGVELPSYPNAWWKWYDDQIALPSQGQKYTSASRVYNQYVSTSYELPPPQPRGECFVAGTLVTTHRGAVAIETIKVGDMVLSKNIATGALEFKPVLQTTVRPIEELTLLKAGGNAFECTRGHFFWVSGRGWVKAEDLRPGMVLHGAENPVKVEEACMGGEAVTYNLRVADNANYFVGEVRILSHDVTARTPTREAIPGYVAAK